MFGRRRVERRLWRDFYQGREECGRLRILKYSVGTKRKAVCLSSQKLKAHFIAVNGA